MSGRVGATDAGRRGLLAGLAAVLAAVAAGVLGLAWPVRGEKRGWRGFRRVKPWRDDQLHEPHDDAG